MKPDDDIRFANLMQRLDERFGTPDRPLSEAKIAIYFEDLRSLPIEGIEYAEAEWGKRQKWFPKPADLRELAMGWQARQPAPALLRGEDVLTPEEARGLIRRLLAQMRMPGDK
jgi:hypothetical protein